MFWQSLNRRSLDRWRARPIKPVAKAEEDRQPLIDGTDLFRRKFTEDANKESNTTGQRMATDEVVKNIMRDAVTWADDHLEVLHGAKSWVT